MKTLPGAPASATARPNTQAVCSVAYDLGFITAQAMQAQGELNAGNFKNAQFLIGEMVGTVARCNVAARDLKEEVAK